MESRPGSQPVVLGCVQDANRRLKTGLAMVSAALLEARVEREEIECLALGLGPGSYTGIRSAIALAQGWQLARGTRLLGLSTVECLAAQAQSDGLFGRVSIVIDAQRNEFYLARYEVSAGERREIEPLRLASQEAVAELAARGELVVGPEATRWLEGATLLEPDAAMLGRLAAARIDYCRGETLEPIYLRPVSFVKAPPPRVFS